MTKTYRDGLLRAAEIVESDERKLRRFWFKEGVSEQEWQEIVGRAVGLLDVARIIRSEAAREYPLDRTAGNAEPPQVGGWQERAQRAEAERDALREAGQQALDYLTLLYNERDIDGQVGGEIIGQLHAALATTEGR